ncbi:MAG TPA: GNAT family N-acetyltransferase [Mucilaginibacter sp.]|jgi:N-acetylglutamate synthase-like GNAT family acetyltransferase|nr:GNAT family N-acetyltransferase [Mucilaginibacter sp.]
MNIRNATYHDAPALKGLLEQLGYTSRISMIVDQIERMFNKEDHQVFVYELRKEVVGFASVHYLPQLAFDGGVMIISYFSVDDAIKDTAIGGELEQYITKQARLKKCERIQVHCLDWRTPAHEFYRRHGYTEYPKYFTKRLVYGE